jgi:hypothetical protein
LRLNTITGTSVQVFGVIISPGKTYTIGVVIDGQQNTRTIDSVDDTSTIVTADSADPTRMHRLLFKPQSDLPPGNHTLVFSIINSDEGAVVAVDYILYTPDFQTIRDKPVFSLGGGDSQPDPVSPTGSGSGPGSGSGSDPGSSKSNVGAIAGGTVGGIVFCVLIILGLWLRWRRQKKRRSLEESQARVQEPFTQVTQSSKKGLI